MDKNLIVANNVFRKCGIKGKDGKIIQFTDSDTPQTIKLKLIEANPQQEIKEELTNQSNEFLYQLINKVVISKTLDQLKNIPDFSIFNRFDNINGITELLNVNLPSGYKFDKDFKPEQYNVKEQRINKQYAITIWKEYFAVQYSPEIINRAFVSPTNFVSFIKIYIRNIYRTSALYIYERMRTMLGLYPSRKSLMIKVKDLNNIELEEGKLISRLIEKQIALLKLPSYDYNETSGVEKVISSSNKSGIAYLRNIHYNGDIETNTLAVLYNSDKLEVSKIKAHDILIDVENRESWLTDTQKLLWKITDIDKFHYGTSINVMVEVNLPLNLKSIKALHVWRTLIALKAFSNLSVYLTTDDLGDGIDNKIITISDAEIETRFNEMMEKVKALDVETLNQKYELSTTSIKDRNKQIKKALKEVLPELPANIEKYVDTYMKTLSNKEIKKSKDLDLIISKGIKEINDNLNKTDKNIDKIKSLLK